MRDLTPIFLAFGLALVGAAPAVGQEPLPETGPLVLTVRPSGYGSGQETRERQERLLRRAERRDYAFRTICRGCGAVAGGTPVGAAFFPLAALAEPERPSQPPPGLTAGAKPDSGQHP